MAKLNFDVFRDKVAGCWAGKNIGGTLGEPFEGDKNINHITYYTQELLGNPAPNDDLDLQLIWLRAIQENGLDNISAQLLGEYWVDHINGPWNEYGTAKKNMYAGLLPPLSGSCNNDYWKNSNGAWIRSEIWACCFPGEPDRVLEYAYMDSCIDHAGDGIYAELFTAALESAAFVVNDVNALIRIALSKIPKDCRVARSVRIAQEGYEKGQDWTVTREQLVKDSEDLGFFQAPANIGYVVMGLLYGGGDFGKSMCIAVNCGDDTDCTGSTVGAVCGILYGLERIPKKWLDPVNGRLAYKCINAFLKYPTSLEKLSEQVVHIAKGHHITTPGKLEFTGGASEIDPDFLAGLCETAAAEKIWAKSPYTLDFDLPHMHLYLTYCDGPFIRAHEPKKIRVMTYLKLAFEQIVTLKWRLPEGWSAQGGDTACNFMGGGCDQPEAEFTLVPGELPGGFVHLELEVKDSRRLAPTVLTVPFQCGGSVHTSFDILP